MSDCRFGVSPVNYPDPDPDREIETVSRDMCFALLCIGRGSSFGILINS